MAHRVVCISRVTAAGGEAIGHAIAERLGFRYVDDEVITLAAESAGVDPAVVEDAEHERSLLARLVDALVAPPGSPAPCLRRAPRSTTPARRRWWSRRTTFASSSRGRSSRSRAAATPSSWRTRRRMRWRGVRTR